MQNVQLLGLVNQINNGNGLGKMAKASLDAKTKLQVYKLTRQISDSPDVKALEDYRQQLAQELQDGTKTQDQADLEFQETLQQESELQLDKITVPADSLPEDFTVQDMLACDSIVEFE